MKVINIPKKLAITPLKVRALLGLFCRFEKIQDIVFDPSPAASADVRALDRQNALLAREICFRRFRSVPTEAADTDDLFDAYDLLIGEYFALHFVKTEEVRNERQQAIEALADSIESDDVGYWFSDRLGFDRAAEIQAALVRDYFMSELRRRRAA